MFALHKRCSKNMKLLSLVKTERYLIINIEIFKLLHKPYKFIKRFGTHSYILQCQLAHSRRKILTNNNYLGTTYLFATAGCGT